MQPLQDQKDSSSHTFTIISATRKKQAIKSQDCRKNQITGTPKKQITNLLINLTDLRNFGLETQAQGAVKILTSNKPYDVYNNVLVRE